MPYRMELSHAFVVKSHSSNDPRPSPVILHAISNDNSRVTYHYDVSLVPGCGLSGDSLTLVKWP